MDANNIELESNDYFISILLVEDNPDHQELIIEALEEANVAENSITVKSDGEKAWKFLHKLSESINGNVRGKLLKIILLDINLHQINGLELLKKIKEDVNLKVIPVIILTTSRNERDISEVYNNHANSYLSKPIKFEEFATMIKSLMNYWVCTNT